MANREHEKIVRGGTDNVRRWKEQHPDERLDLDSVNLQGTTTPEIDLSHANIRKAQLTRINLRGANLAGADLSNATLLGGNFTATDFSNATLVEANLVEADLRDAIFDGADLTDATLERAQITPASLCKAKALLRTKLSLCELGNADFRNVTFEGANFQQAVLQGANFAGANLRAASFVAAKLEGADFSRADLSDANLSRSSMNSANLRSATLHNAKLETADLRGANIGKADFTEALIEDANFSHAIGAPSARNLETTALSAVRYFDRVELNWFDRYCDWEHARIFGRLPLFTASYTAMIAIPIVAYGYALYNDAAQSLQKWATTIGPSAGPSQKGIADFVIANLHTVPLPALSLELLVSTVLLAIASTIYAVWCPSRIKEFSRDQWCDEFGKPLIHYCALSWKYPVRRSVCRWRRTRRLRYLGKSRQRRHLHFSELRMGIGVQPDCLTPIWTGRGRSGVIRPPRSAAPARPRSVPVTTNCRGPTTDCRSLRWAATAPLRHLWGINMPEPIDVDVFRAYMNSLQERLDAAQTARLQILAAAVRTGRILQSSFTVIIILLGIIAGALIFP